MTLRIPPECAALVASVISGKARDCQRPSEHVIVTHDFEHSLSIEVGISNGRVIRSETFIRKIGDDHWQAF